MQWRGTRDAGFTRIDALATLSAMAILVFIAFPLMATGQSRSRTAVCFDNLRQLGRAIALYTVDQCWYPPNPDDGNITPGYNWCPGQAGPGGAQEFNADILQSPTSNLLTDYLDSRSDVYRCPADKRIGVYNGPDAAKRRARTPVLAARSVSMNGAVGVNPAVARGKQPVNGPWLDNNYGHTYGHRWRTYGRPDQIIAPTPARLFVLIDEDARSINDAAMQVGMQGSEWIDFPGTRHDTCATVSFADEHVEVRRWVDPRTIVTTTVARRPVPESADLAWLQSRTSAEIVH